MRFRALQRNVPSQNETTAQEHFSGVLYFLAIKSTLRRYNLDVPNPILAKHGGSGQGEPAEDSL